MRPSICTSSVLAAFTERISSSSFSCMTLASRLWVFWIRKTIKKVPMEVPVLMTSCHVSE